ncbi:MAG: hypothetical protein ACFFG0_28335 [Candidatus Thorarchaeota archaeon]
MNPCKECVVTAICKRKCQKFLLYYKRKECVVLLIHGFIFHSILIPSIIHFPWDLSLQIFLILQAVSIAASILIGLDENYPKWYWYNEDLIALSFLITLAPVIPIALLIFYIFNKVFDG